MAVSDLTNTKWVLNSALAIFENTFSYSINFTSNNTNYTTFASVDEGGDLYVLKYDNTAAFEDWDGATTWYNDAYKTIEITGGTDVTNATLIAWLEANATQQVANTGMYVGTKKVTDIYVGNKRVLKVYVGNKKCYEKQAPTPSGYTVQILTSIGYSGEANNAKYSLDDGATWVTLYDAEVDPPQYKTITLNNVTQIKFMCDDPNGANWGKIESTQLNLNLDGHGGPNYSQNYMLTQDVTDIRAYTYYD